MGSQSESSFTSEYLVAKKKIDDHSINLQVFNTLKNFLQKQNSVIPLTILEIGAGIGTMLARMVEWKLLQGKVKYIATDNDIGQIPGAQHYLSSWAKKKQHQLIWLTERQGELKTGEAEITILLDVMGAEDENRLHSLPTFDLLVAHAILDLIDFTTTLLKLFSRLHDEGLAYLTCNFDGKTEFLPEHHHDFEIIEMYHNSMEARKPGATRSGRNLISFFQQHGIEILAAGASDWLIPPAKKGYRFEEKFFLKAILAMIEKEYSTAKSQDTTIKEWVKLRNEQIEEAKLCLFASHLDFLVRP